jgi:hypothetical protein
MEDLMLQKLKVSLNETIQYWIDNNADSSEFNALDTSVSDFISELMTDAAFAVLMAQSDLTSYYKREEMLND